MIFLQWPVDEAFMKIILFSLMIILISSCQGENGSKPASEAEPVLDARLTSGSGTWEAYDAGTNIDDMVRFIIRNPGLESENVEMYLRSNYRGGSLIADAHYILTPLTDASAYAQEFDGTMRTGDMAAEYTFIDDDTLNVCFDSDCITFTRQ